MTPSRAPSDFRTFTGANLDAWIDLRIDDASDLQRRCPEQYSALIECSALVKQRQIEGGRQPVLALMLVGRF